jgi:hypothetical protein
LIRQKGRRVVVGREEEGMLEGFAREERGSKRAIVGAAQGTRAFGTAAKRWAGVPNRR